METSVFGGGCFWCIEAVFKRIKGVGKVMPGYAGGRSARPSYREVCGGGTAHAEVVKVDFDPAEVSYRALLEVFFKAHDPTTPNRQGGDVGDQYRSVILYLNDEQKKEAQTYIAILESEKVFPRPIVTQVKPLGEFYEAEEYHRDYYAQHQDQAYCRLVITPKLAKFKDLPS